MNVETVGDSKLEKTSRSPLRFGIATLLMSMTLIATLVASETNRYRHRRIVEGAFEHSFSDTIGFAPRFEKLDRDGKFVSTVSSLLGSRWNETITSLVIGKKQLEDRVFESVTQLKHLRTLGLLHVELTDSQVAKLKKMKSLQWIYLIDTNVDQAAISALRESLPNTFVNGFAHPPSRPPHSRD